MNCFYFHSDWFLVVVAEGYTSTSITAPALHVITKTKMCVSSLQRKSMMMAHMLAFHVHFFGSASMFWIIISFHLCCTGAPWELIACCVFQYVRNAEIILISWIFIKFCGKVTDICHFCVSHSGQYQSSQFMWFIICEVFNSKRIQKLMKIKKLAIEFVEEKKNHHQNIQSFDLKLE